MNLGGEEAVVGHHRQICKEIHTDWLGGRGSPLIMPNQWGDKEHRNSLNKRQLPSSGFVRQLHLWQWRRMFAWWKWTSLKDNRWLICTYQVSSDLEPAWPWNNRSEEESTFLTTGTGIFLTDCNLKRSCLKSEIIFHIFPSAFIIIPTSSCSITSYRKIGGKKIHIHYVAHDFQIKGWFCLHFFPRLSLLQSPSPMLQNRFPPFFLKSWEKSVLLNSWICVAKKVSRAHPNICILLSLQRSHHFCNPSAIFLTI